jgi:hypothetical protein
MGIVNKPFGLQQKLECQKLLHFFQKERAVEKTISKEQNR